MSRPLHVNFLYEDDDLIAVDKPAGLPTISPEGSRTRSLYDLVTDHIRKRNPKGRAALVHRLDRDTSGVMVFAKNAAAKTRLMGDWNELVAQRRYVALVDGTPPESEGMLDSWLAEAGPGRMKESRNQVKGALRAITRYRVLKAGPVHSLVELELETGRKHQIRVQLAGLGYPVAGDAKYGSRTDPIGRLGLHACLIELSPEAGKALLRFESPVPDSFFKATRLAVHKSEAPARPDSSKAQATRPATHGARPAASADRPATPAWSGHHKKRGALPEARPGGRASKSSPAPRGTDRRKPPR